MSRCGTTFLLLATLSLGLPPAVAQRCQPQWLDTFSTKGFDDVVNALAVFNDGSGDHLYAAGAFTTAGGTPASRIAKWNGTSWVPLGLGVTGPVFALAVFDDDGTGPHTPALYAAGNFTSAGGFSAYRIAKWTGSVWYALSTGLDGTAYALTVYDDDDTGPHLPALYAGGLFTSAGSVTANYIAKWDGTAWSAVGGGMNHYVKALATFDDDATGPHLPALYAGGGFTVAGPVVANYIAKWNGSTWSALSSGPSQNGVNNTVQALAVFDDDGAGPRLPALYAGGYFTAAGTLTANRCIKWTGTTWAALGSGLSGPVSSLLAFDDDGTGSDPSALYAGGVFTSAGGGSALNIARWSGTAWSPLTTGTNAGVYALAAFDNDGAGSNPPGLYVGGDFTTAGGQSSAHVAHWSCTGGTAPPVIDIQPTPQTVCVGDEVTFTVKATGDDPLSYQWRKGGIDIPDAIEVNYVIPAAAAADAGNYDVVVTNPGGSTPSNTATLTVNTPPAITQPPTNQSACVADAATFTVTASGTAPTYQWRKGGVDIPEATDAIYTIDPVTPDDAGSYDVVVTNMCDTQTSTAATLTIGTGPAISQSPTDQHVFAGAALEFSVTANGNPAPSFQWRKGGIDLTDDGRITGATTATLQIDPVALSDAGDYDVVVENTCGSDTSDPATLTVYLAGDMNCDSTVDFGDINPFVLYLSSFPVWQATYAGCPPENGDIDGDGTFGQNSFGDINPFVVLLGGGGD